MPFQIEQLTSVRLSNINPRMEKHGHESVPAVDMNFIMDAQSQAVFDGEPLFPVYAPDAPLTAEDVFIGTATADELAAVH